jgi:hypothetical protein
MKTQAGLDPTLRRIMVLGGSLGFGFAMASLQALQPNFTFQISLKTPVAFLLGSAMLFLYWKILLHPSQSPGQKRLRVVATAVLAFAGVGGFLYPLKFIAPNNHAEVMVGLATAFCGLSGVAALLLCCKRFLEKDARKNGH